MRARDRDEILATELEVGRLDTVHSQEKRVELLIGPGTQIEHYEIIREIGRGGMGRVLLARDTQLGRLVALKFLLSPSNDMTLRFLSEAQATARVQHENIVIIHEVNEYRGHPYMVLEYLQGRTLRELIEAHAPYLWHRAVDIMLPVVRALVCAHEHGIVHRDLKPENILVTKDGQTKVLDFGIAKFFPLPRAKESDFAEDDSDPTLVAPTPTSTRSGLEFGTMPYMSPEQWGLGEVDAQSDIWAVGTILYEMVVGARPFKQETRSKLRFQIAISKDLAPCLAVSKPGTSLELSQVVAGCLEKEKTARISSASDLVASLQQIAPGYVGRALGKGENPFPGLLAFQEQDAGRFFGRSQDIVRVIKKLDERPMLGIVGSSGVGKSSLIRAGVVPVLKASGDAWETLVIRPGRTPIASLVALIAPLVPELKNDVVAAHEAWEAKLRELPGALGMLLRAYARERRTKILLFVDQFEELYTLDTPLEDRRTFAAALCGVGDDPESPLRVLVTMRSDFLDHVGETRAFLDQLTPGILFLQPLDTDGIRKAITLPVEVLGYRYENSEMIRSMLESLNNASGALPLLQFAASKLWEQRDEKRKLLTEHSYLNMGGVEGTLATHANEILAALSQGRQKLVKAIFQHLVTAQKTRAIADLSELRSLSEVPSEIDDLIRHLVNARLLTAQSRDGVKVGVEIVHESLITQWPSLRGWLEEVHEDAAFVEQLRVAARQWEQKGRPLGLLWRAEAFEEARRFRKRYQGELGHRENAFLDAVFLLEKRIRGRKRLAISSLVVILAGLVVASGVALVTIRQAEKEAVTQAESAKVEKMRAQDAELEVRNQLALISEKERARLKAERQAVEAKRQAQEGRTAIAESKEELKEALAIATKARAVAVKAKVEAEEVRRTTQKLLDRRSRELARLKAQGRKINKQLD